MTIIGSHIAMRTTLIGPVEVAVLFTGPVVGAVVQYTLKLTADNTLEVRTEDRTVGRKEVMTDALHRLEDAQPFRTVLIVPVTVKEENTLMLFFFLCL